METQSYQHVVRLGTDEKDRISETEEKEMSITAKLETIYWKVRYTRNRTCLKIDEYIDGCSDCPYHNQYRDDCEFEDIMKDIKDLINVVDPLGIYRDEEEEE